MAGTYNGVNSDFYITQLDNLYTDPVKKTLWKMKVNDDIWKDALKYGGRKMVNFEDSFTNEEFKWHIQSVSGLPNVKTITADLNFHGMKKHVITGFNGLDGTIDFTVLFMEDLRAAQALLAWREAGVRSGILASGPGEDSYSDKSRALLTGMSKTRAAADAKYKGGANVVMGTVQFVNYNFYDHTEIMTYNLHNCILTEANLPSNFDYTTPALAGPVECKLTFDYYDVKMKKIEGLK